VVVAVEGVDILARCCPGFPSRVVVGCRSCSLDPAFGDGLRKVSTYFIAIASSRGMLGGSIDMAGICFQSVLVLRPNRGLKGLNCRRLCQCRRGRLIGIESPPSLSGWPLSRIVACSRCCKRRGREFEACGRVMSVMLGSHDGQGLSNVVAGGG
jgi:hypothetical protein